MVYKTTFKFNTGTTLILWCRWGNHLTEKYRYRISGFCDMCPSTEQKMLTFRRSLHYQWHCNYFDHFGCSQWWKSHQNGNISFSVCWLTHTSVDHLYVDAGRDRRDFHHTQLACVTEGTKPIKYKNGVVITVTGTIDLVPFLWLKSLQAHLQIGYT